MTCQILTAPADLDRASLPSFLPFHAFVIAIGRRILSVHSPRKNSGSSSPKRSCPFVSLELGSNSFHHYFSTTIFVHLPLIPSVPLIISAHRFRPSPHYQITHRHSAMAHTRRISSRRNCPPAFPSKGPIFDSSYNNRRQCIENQILSWLERHSYVGARSVLCSLYSDIYCTISTYPSPFKSTLPGIASSFKTGQWTYR